MAKLLVVAAFAATAQALAVDGMMAKPTMVSGTQGTSPKITTPPSVDDLLRRQNVQSVLLAPDNTCGYVDGKQSLSYTCNDPSAFCALVTTQKVGAFACCNGATCGFRVDCMDMRAVKASSCNSGCQTDPYTLKCTNTAAPFCGTVTFSSGIIDYFCRSTVQTRTLQVLTTYSGQSGRTFAAVDEARTSTIRLSTSTSVPVSVSTTDSPAAASSLVTDGGSTAGGLANADSDGGSTTTPIGPIVGGAVGGVAFLALIAVGVWFFMRQSRKRSTASSQMWVGGAATSRQAQNDSSAPSYPMKSGGMSSSWFTDLKSQELSQYSNSTQNSLHIPGASLPASSSMASDIDKGQKLA